MLQRDGDWLTTDGTTLGADNGVAIAAMLALAEDESWRRAARAADDGGRGGRARGCERARRPLLTGGLLLNLDSGEDGRLTVGSAGSTDTWIRLEAPCPRRRASSELEVTASGGLGGHSGVGYRLGRSNAIKVLGRVLRETLANALFRLVGLDGGKSRDAIPRDAVAVCSVRPAGQPHSGRRLSARPRRSARSTRRPIRA